ncbi:MAG: hypothetical protein LUG55_06385 [Clostridiales bacterium]|nr:hypothetical protein [Clostridiales bacterium]
MEKRTVLWLMLKSIFIVVFNLVFFLLGGFAHPVSVWLSYGFIHFAYCMTVAAGFFKINPTAVYEAALDFFSALYFLAEFVVGLLFILIWPHKMKLALVIQVILAGMYAVGLLFQVIWNQTTYDNTKQQAEDIFYIKNAASRVKLLLDRLDDKKAYQAVERVYDLLHASPSGTNMAAYNLEQEINRGISELEAAVSAKDLRAVMELTERLRKSIAERNRLCALDLNH